MTRRKAMEILTPEREAWEAYRDYITNKMGRHCREVAPDATSIALFNVWRPLYNQRLNESIVNRRLAERRDYLERLKQKGSMQCASFMNTR